MRDNQDYAIIKDACDALIVLDGKHSEVRARLFYGDHLIAVASFMASYKNTRDAMEYLRMEARHYAACGLNKAARAMNVVADTMTDRINRACV